MKRYRISPSLLNAFSGWLNADETYDKYWGESETPPMTCEEFDLRQLDELMAYINREPQEPNEAAERGTALNDLIDMLQFGRETETRYELRDRCYVAWRGDFVFAFDKELVDSLCLVFKTGVPQYHLEASMRQGDREVCLHGYPDYIFPTMIWDLKTTNKYEVGKYAGNWQRWVYPVISVLSGAQTVCETMTFYALECRADKDKVIYAKPYAETYDVNIDEAESKVREFVFNTVLPMLDDWDRMELIPNNNIIEYDAE